MKRTFILFYTLLLFIQVKAQVQPDHVVIVIMENHSYNQIHNSPNAPYINSLLADSFTAALPQSFALAHPSQPNYLMLFSGSNQGVTDDNVPSGVPFTTANLGASLIQHGFSFSGYSETMPSIGYTGATSGRYVRKHNPWVNWQGTGTNGIPQSDNLQLTSFPVDYTTLPTLCFVIPNMDNDMHDGTVAAGDTWLQTHLDNYIQWCKTHNSLFILTFDEDDHSSNNQIVTLFTGQDIKGGTYTQNINHYNVLRTLEDLYSLPYAGASSSAAFISGIWRSALPIELVSFNAYSRGSNNELQWTTSQEINADHFEVERSNNGREFSSLGKVQNTGSSSHYDFTDNHPLKATNYYRLKMVDKDGRFEYGDIKSISNNVHGVISVYPNPVRDILYIRLPADLNGEMQISVSSAGGKAVMRQSTFIGNETADQRINVSSLAKGQYFLTVVNRGIQQVIKFEKE